MSDTTTYRLAGHFFELCDCSTICVCWLGEEPTDGRCTGVFAWSITSGAIGGIDVTGNKVVSASYHTGNRKDGGLDVYLFVDDNSTERQAEALADAFTGKLGGPLGELAKLMGELRGTARASIELINGDRTTTLRVGSSISGTSPESKAVTAAVALENGIWVRAMSACCSKSAMPMCCGVPTPGEA